MTLAQLHPLVPGAAQEIAALDSRVHAVGLALKRGQPVLRALRHASSLQAYTATLPSPTLPSKVGGVPLVVVDTWHSLVPLHKIPGVRSQQTSLPEQDMQRPLALGLQVQNGDHDLRDGSAQQGYRTVGTLGCFALRGGVAQLLSNNHVLAGENRALLGDRIQQPGAQEIVAEQVVAELSGFAPLKFSSQGHLGMAEGVNLVDAARAQLRPVAFANAYLPHHRLRAPTAAREPQLGERVYKVGRTTGLTRGQVSAVLVEAGPVGYEAGEAYFRRSFAVRGLRGTSFSSGGDSGSAIVAAQDGALLGLLYAGDGVETYGCLATEVLRALDVVLKT